MPTENRSSNTEMASELRPCPFCSAAMRVESNRDWHRVMGDHAEECVFTDSETMMVPATDAQRSIMVADCNQRTQPAEQHQGKPVVCAHEWTDDGEFMLVCTACGAQENHDPKWRDMATAPRDGTLIRLLVEFTEHATEDSEAMPSPTIGANSFDHTGEDVWQFAGWSWEQDCFTQGEGEPVGWLPLLDTPHSDPAEVEGLHTVIEQQKSLVESLRAELIESRSIDASAEPSAPELTDDLREILGRPNFTCHFIAKALRVMGHSIAHKSEDEQAVVIHWLLGIYLKHGPDWRQRAAAELEEASQSLST